MDQEDIKTLVAKTAALEERLWGGEPRGGNYISESGLRRVLSQAGRYYFAPRKEGGKSRRPPLGLTEAVNELIERHSRKEEKQWLLSIQHAALVQLVENIFRFMEYSHDLDPEAFAAMRGLQVCMARTAVTDVATLTSPGRPPRQFLELLLQTCRGCDQHAGFRSQTLLARIEQTVQEMLASPLPAEQACHAAREELSEFVLQYERESLGIEQGLAEKEHAQALQERWQQAIKAEAFGVLAGKRLPKAALEFFDQVWSQYLFGMTQWESADGNAWDRGVGAVHSLVGSLSIRDPEQMLTCYSGMLTEVLDVFRQGAEQIEPDSPLTRSFVEQMEAFCLRVVEGEEPDPAQMIDVPPDAYDLETVEVTDAAELARIDAMQEGTWYLLLGQGVEKRGKLIQKNSEDQYCLFVNYSGIKTARLDFHQVITGLESGTVRPVEMETVSERALEYATGQMEELIPHLQTKVEEVETERKQLLEATLEKERQAETLRLLREKKLQEAEAAREQARHDAEKQARRNAEQRADKVRVARERTLEMARSDVERMQAGGRLEMAVEGREKLVCELGVRLKSSGKMIFVDSLGRKQLELLPEELAGKIAAGDGRILDFGATFDDTLRSLIVEHSSRIPVE